MSDWTTTGTETSAEGNYIDDTDIDNWTDGATSAEKLAVIQRAEQLIEKITKDYFYAKAFSDYWDGNGKDKLFLGLIPNILSVTEILLSGIELDSTYWTFNTTSVYLDPEVAIGDDYPELLLRLGHTQKLFPKGMGNIKITGTYGWASCPPAIKRAAIMLCRYENDDTLYSAHDGNLKSEKLGDYAYTVSDNVSAKDSTGIDEVDKLLRNYIRKKPILG